MAGRGMLFAEGPTACPFVALESDRDRRAAEPDPRHRCYAEPTPAPRALAHQREFCLSPQFGGCPIFQDWAVRAAARPVPLRPLGASIEERPPAASGPQQLPAFAGLTEEPEAERDEPQPAAEKPDAGDARPAPPLIPPPYTGAYRAPEPESVGGRSLDPQPVERIPSMPLEAPAGGDVPRFAEPDRAADPAPAEPPAAEPPAAEPHEAEPAPAADPPRRRWTADWPPSASAAGAAPLAPGRSPEGAGPEPTASPPRRTSQLEVGRPLPGRRSREARPSRRDEWSAQRADLIPPWERERYSGYPTLLTRLGMGDGDALLSRLTRILTIIAIGALIIALLLLAPGFFAGGGPGAPLPTGTRSPSPTASTPEPTPTVTPQPTVSFGSYVVQAGDSLSAIAAEFGLLICQVQAANPEITDPNDIFIGQVISIPPDDFALDECLATPATSP